MAQHYFFGFTLWKRFFFKPFFKFDKEIVFINPFFKKNYFRLAIKKGFKQNSEVYIWGRKSYPELENFCKENSININRIEDGFIRSVGLGSDLTQPYSLVIDSRGIYFDPTQESDLEYILSNHNFDEELLKRAKDLRHYLIEKKLSKYNLYANQKLDIQTDKKIVLVPGQVEDDASIRFGANGMTNLKLLQMARESEKDAYIIYKPHPDVLVGNRVGHIEESEALQYADEVITEVGLDSVLEVCDAVHTMTSLVGFEALMREKELATYGMPFYAGWGLSKDNKVCERRKRKLSLDQLVAATLILYPKYIDPDTKVFCDVEELLVKLDEEKRLYDNSTAYRLKKSIYSFITRKLQLLLRIITLKK